MAEFSHIDADGKAVMVDVSDKDVTERSATAKGAVFMRPETVRRIVDGGVKKGDVLSGGGGGGRRRAPETTQFIPRAPPH